MAASQPCTGCEFILTGNLKLPVNLGGHDSGLVTRRRRARERRAAAAAARAERRGGSCHRVRVTVTPGPGRA
jgi:hypothetical protein